MAPKLFHALIGMAFLSLCACNGGSTTDGTVRAVNGISDTSGLNVTVNGQNAVTDLGLDTASAVINVPVGVYNATLTDGSIAYLVDNVTVGSGDVTTVVSYGSTANNTQGGLAAEESLTTPAAGDVSVQLVHAAYETAKQGESPSPQLTLTFSTPATPCMVGSTDTYSGTSAVSGGPAILQGFAQFGPVTPTSTQVLALPASNQSISVINSDGVTLFCSGTSGVATGTGTASVYQLIILDATAAQQTQYGSTVSLLLLDNDGGQKILYNGQN